MRMTVRPGEESRCNKRFATTFVIAMSQDNASQATHGATPASKRLHKADPARFKISRRRCGKGFSYLDEKGNVIRDKALKAQFQRLVIPPAWTEVRLARKANAHIQAVGRDTAGRQQYIYHPDWEEHRTAVKERRLVQLGKALPRIRNAVRNALSTPKLTPQTVKAAVVRLIDKSLLRPGHEAYAKERGTRGAATLLKSDVTVKGGTIIVDAIGKAGKQIHKEVRDPALARVVRKLQKLPGPRLFQITDGHGGLRPITASDVNHYIADRAGANVSAKDFRTFEASAAALSQLCDEDANNQTQRKRALVAVADFVSDKLANTRSVARSSYIHPKVTQAFESGKLRSRILKGKTVSGLTKMESALMRFLRRRDQT